MALVDNAWYINYGDGAAGAGKKSWFDVTAWATGVVTAAGTIVRQLAAPAVGSERVFVCVVAGTTHASTEPTWVVTRGALTTDNTVTWQECTGIAALNGDATNTPSWTITATPPGGVKNTAVTLGQVIKRDAGTSYQICTIAGTAGNGAEPAFSNTAGATTVDNTATWTSLGVVGNFTGWQAPHQRVENAVASTWGQAGNTFYIANNHASTRATGVAISSPGTTSSPCFFYSVNRAGSLPPVSADLTTTSVMTLTGNSNLTIGSTAAKGSSYWYGLICNIGTLGNSIVIQFGSQVGELTTLENCAVNIVATGAAASIITSPTNSNSGIITLINTPVAFTATGQFINVRGGTFVWKKTPSALSGTLPTSLFISSSSPMASLYLQGVDLGNLGAGKTILGTNTATTPSKSTFIDCKLGASVTLSAALTCPGQIADFIRCDSGATNYFDARYSFFGTQTQETTIVRTGGASDGTTPISWNITSGSSNPRWVTPFESQPISIWNDSTSAITTLTIYGTTTGGGVPNNDDIWVEVEYLGSALTPQGSFITTTKADNLAASVTTNNSSDASTWGGSGAGNGFKILVPSFTPGMKGPINITVKVAKASSTYYIDPKVSI